MPALTKILTHFRKAINPASYISYRHFITSSDFEKMVLHVYKSHETNPLPFVDKTMLISAMLNAPSTTILITQPRRSGKSMNLDMLQKFLEVVPNLEKKHKPLFAGGKKHEDDKTYNLNPLKISKETWALEHQGKYPVIKLDFKDLTSRKISSIAEGIKLELKGILAKYCLEDREESLKTEIKEKGKEIDEKGKEIDEKGKEIIEYSNLIKNIITKIVQGNEANIILLKEERKELKQQQEKLEQQQEKLEQQQEKLEQQQAELKQQFEEDPKIYLQQMAKDLCHKLYSKYSKKVYVLIDEYDKPVNAFTEIHNIKEYDEEMRAAVVDMISGFISAMGKSNYDVERVIMIGIFNTLQIEGNSGLNNVKVYDVESSYFAEYFGFTESEIDKQLAKPLGITQDDAWKKGIKEWYNGYNAWIGKGEHISIYSAWSTMNFLEEYSRNPSTTPKSYWARSGTNIVLGNFKLSTSQLDHLKQLKDGAEVLLASQAALTGYDFNKEAPDTAVSYALLHSGYVTPSCTDTGMKKEGMYQIPNKEVAVNFNKEVLEKWIKEAFPTINYREAGKVLTENLENVQKLQEAIKKYVLEPLADKKYNESDFQGLLRGILGLYEIERGQSAFYEVRSEYKAEGITKKADIILIPKMQGKNFIVIELKAGIGSEFYSDSVKNAGYKKGATKKPTSSADIAKLAFEQVFAKGYLSAQKDFCPEANCVVYGISIDKRKESNKWDFSIETMSVKSQDAGKLLKFKSEDKGMEKEFKDLDKNIEKIKKTAGALHGSIEAVGDGMPFNEAEAILKSIASTTPLITGKLNEAQSVLDSKKYLVFDSLSPEYTSLAKNMNIRFLGWQSPKSSDCFNIALDILHKFGRGGIAYTTLEDGKLHSVAYVSTSMGEIPKQILSIEHYQKQDDALAIKNTAQTNNMIPYLVQERGAEGEGLFSVVKKLDKYLEEILIKIFGTGGDKNLIELAQNYQIEIEGQTLEQINRKLALKLHPDKGGNKEAFQELQKVYEEATGKPSATDTNRMYVKTSNLISKINLGIKTADTVLDGVKLWQEPSENNTLQFLVSGVHLYSMTTKNPSISLGMGAVGIILQIHNEDYTGAMQTATITVGYTLGMVALSTTFPAIPTATSIGLTTYSACSVAYKGYEILSGYIERQPTEIQSELSSNTTYNEMEL